MVKRVVFVRRNLFYTVDINAVLYYFLGNNNTARVNP